MDGIVGDSKILGPLIRSVKRESTMQKIEQQDADGTYDPEMHSMSLQKTIFCILLK
jgi:hypothetical protein